MEQRFGLTAEMYRAIVAVVDERTRSIRIMRKDFDRLAEAQARTEAALNRLAEAQARTEEEFRQYREASEARFARIEAALDRLAEAQARTEERLNRLAEVLEKLSSIVERLDSQVAELRGWQLELRYYHRVASFFGAILRKARTVSISDIEEELEAKLPERDVLDLFRLDMLVYGQPRKRPDLPPIWVAVEISGVIDRGDITRAMRRAELLKRAGFVAIPAVAGIRATDWVKEEAFENKVLLMEDGHIFFWEEALSTLQRQEGL